MRSSGGVYKAVRGCRRVAVTCFPRRIVPSTSPGNARPAGGQGSALNTSFAPNRLMWKSPVSADGDSACQDRSSVMTVKWSFICKRIGTSKREGRRRKEPIQKFWRIRTDTFINRWVRSRKPNPGRFPDDDPTDTANQPTWWGRSFHQLSNAVPHPPRKLWSRVSYWCWNPPRANSIPTQPQLILLSEQIAKENQ